MKSLILIPILSLALLGAGCVATESTGEPKEINANITVNYPVNKFVEDTETQRWQETDKSGWNLQLDQIDEEHGYPSGSYWVRWPGGAEAVRNIEIMMVYPVEGTACFVGFFGTDAKPFGLACVPSNSLDGWPQD